MDILEDTNIQELLLSELMHATKSMTIMTSPSGDKTKTQVAAGVSRSHGGEHFSLEEEDKDADSTMSEMLNRAQNYGTPASAS
jgi:hypothetical protein